MLCPRWESKREDGGRRQREVIRRQGGERGGGGGQPNRTIVASLRPLLSLALFLACTIRPQSQEMFARWFAPGTAKSKNAGGGGGRERRRESTHRERETHKHTHAHAHAHAHSFSIGIQAVQSPRCLNSCCSDAHLHTWAGSSSWIAGRACLPRCAALCSCTIPTDQCGRFGTSRAVLSWVVFLAPPTTMEGMCAVEQGRAGSGKCDGDTPRP